MARPPEEERGSLEKGEVALAPRLPPGLGGAPRVTATKVCSRPIAHITTTEVRAIAWSWSLRRVLQKVRNGLYFWYSVRQLGPASPMTTSQQQLPPEVMSLAWREREVAAIVYAQGAPTAKDVQSSLSADVSNGAVRSMLVRLVNKGILRRRWGSRGRGHQFIYMPAVTPADTKCNALRTLTDRYFDGSLISVARTLLTLLEKNQLSEGEFEEAAVAQLGGKEAERVNLAA